MDLIKDLLSKYSKLKPKNEDRKKAVIEAAFKYAGVGLKKEDISFGGWAVYLKASSQAKAELQMHKNQILSELKELLGKAAPRNII